MDDAFTISWLLGVLVFALQVETGLIFSDDKRAGRTIALGLGLILAWGYAGGLLYQWLNAKFGAAVANVGTVVFVTLGPNLTATRWIANLVRPR